MGAAEGCGSALQVDCLEGFDTPGLHQTTGCDCHIWETAVCNSRWSAVQLCYTPPNNGLTVWDGKRTCNAMLGDRYSIGPPNN